MSYSHGPAPSRLRLTPRQRRKVILRAARAIMNLYGEEKLTALEIARICDPPTSASTVKYHFPGGRDCIADEINKKTR